MWRHFPFFLALLGVASLVACSGSAEPGADAQMEFTEWAASQALAIESLQGDFSNDQTEWLERAIGDAQVVGIGESRHDTHEQLLLKSLLTRCLIQDLEFRVFILEESHAHVFPLDRFLTSGEGDLREILNSLAGWYLWDTEGMVELFSWIREFNKDLGASEQVRVFGMDITAPALGVQSALSLLTEAGLELPIREEDLGLDLQSGDHWQTTMGRYATLPEEQRQALSRSYQLLESFVASEQDRIKASTSAQVYERLALLVEMGAAGNNFFLATSMEEGGSIREAGMAKIVQWIRSTGAQGQKALLWTHNLHSAASPFRIPGISESALEPMGILLKEQMGDSYLAIGASFGKGAYGRDLPPGERTFAAGSEDTMDGALAALNRPQLLLDLREVPNGSVAHSWLQQERDWMAQDFTSSIVPGDAFDLVYFVAEISREMPTPAALERFQVSR